jgi:hypothetical protein
MLTPIISDRAISRRIILCSTATGDWRLVIGDWRLKTSDAPYLIIQSNILQHTVNICKEKIPTDITSMGILIDYLTTNTFIHQLQRLTR